MSDTPRTDHEEEWMIPVNDQSESLPAVYSSFARDLEREVAALDKALDPRRWTKEMSDAWHRNIPDLYKAFAALVASVSNHDA